MVNVGRVIVGCVVIVSLLLSNSVSSQSAASLKAPIKVGFMSSIKRVHEGEYVGPLPDVIRATVSDINHGIKLQAMPIKRLLKSLETGQVDVVIGLFKRDDREVYADFLSIPIGWVCANMFVAQDNTSVTADPNSLAQKRIGMLRGANWGEELANVFSEHQVSRTDVANYDMLVKMLDKGRFDGVVASSDAFKSAARKLDLQHQIVGLPLPSANSLAMYILVSKNSVLAQEAQLTDKLNLSLEKLTKNSTIRQIYRRHGKTFDEHCHK
ncbi:transporter substrate-binding domain-containing protein [Psychrobium sp. MM17-31]|uniref:substrate-binding periplasmic protein n=1 Tax=Psychrobium sp. MM17-31 TaxID=2917758 RepID=UPI001EF54E67|nr:transporter substrate-binding domain-containing protein [Psychrobium sp. MM17-31]MCG7530046.1 transporter substrate-binding domain-containing protein [Psychrobium sp. MM17-31]